VVRNYKGDRMSRIIKMYEEEYIGEINQESKKEKDLQKLLEILKNFQDRHHLLRQYPPRPYTYAE
jgi:hypothetical protein